MAFPKGSVRDHGYDRAVYADGSVLDVPMGRGSELARAKEDGIFKGIWITGFHGEHMWVELAPLQIITEWRPDSMILADAENALFDEHRKKKELLGDSDA